MSAGQHMASSADGKRIENVGGDVVPHVEVGGAAKFFRIEDVLNGGTLLPGAGFGSGTVIDRVRPGVVDVEGQAAGKAAAHRDSHRVERAGAGGHPGGPGA